MTWSAISGSFASVWVPDEQKNESVLWASHPPAIGVRRYSEGAGVRLRPLYDAHYESLISLLHSNCSNCS
jgi:hypothetical protein